MEDKTKCYKDTIFQIRGFEGVMRKCLSRRVFAPGFVNYNKWYTRLAAASDKAYQLLAHGRWFSPSPPASSVKVSRWLAMPCVYQGPRSLSTRRIKVAKSFQKILVLNPRNLLLLDDLDSEWLKYIVNYGYTNTNQYLFTLSRLASGRIGLFQGVLKSLYLRIWTPLMFDPRHDHNAHLTLA
jgi:hypothetical protein